MAEGYAPEGHAPEGALTDKNLLDISYNIGNGWQSLAVYLQIPQTQIDHIKADHKPMHQQIYNMLLRWKSTRGCNANLTSLLHEMENVPKLTIDWEGLKKKLGPAFVDIVTVFHKRSDDRQQASSQVPINFSHLGHIQEPSANVAQVSWAVLQQDLIAYYRKWFSILAISPLIDDANNSANFLEIYVKPILAIPSHQSPQGPRSKSLPVTQGPRSKSIPVTQGPISKSIPVTQGSRSKSIPVTQRPRSQSTSVNSCHDIFVKDSKSCQNIYISSPAGCGKTALTKWLALTWCQAHDPIESDNKWFIADDVDEMRTFILLFCVYLRELDQSECDVDDMIQNQLLRRLANSKQYEHSGLLKNLLNNVKCIILLDGLDEWNHPVEEQCLWPNKHIPHSRARPQCATLTTSRPWKLDIVGLKPGEIDQRLELNGLEGDLLKHLISNVLTKMNTLYSKEMVADDFRQKLRDKKLTELSKIPVIVMQLLCVWFDNEQLGESQCEIYSNMIEFLFKRFYKKRDSVSGMEGIAVNNFERHRRIPLCLKMTRYCKIHLSLLSKLATLAYNTLFTENEDSSLVFDRKIAKKYLNDKQIDMSLAVGILTQEKILDKITIKQSHISFIHKTFQEYLAALYVALNPGTVNDVIKKIKHVCGFIENMLEMSQIFMFLSGLCPNVMVKLQEHLRQTVSEDSGTQRYRASCELHPESSEGETLQRVQDTMREWLVECWLNRHKHVPHLPVSDFFIGPSNWCTELKDLTAHNPVCSLYVTGVNQYSAEERKDILNSVTVFNSIQKLLFSWESETFVFELISEHMHSLSVAPKIWSHLECVTLVWVTMSSDFLFSLIDSILQLPKSVQVRLEKCFIEVHELWGHIEQETRDWKTYIRSHPQLTVNDYDVDNKNIYWGGNVKLLQFHTNKEHVSQ